MKAVTITLLTFLLLVCLASSSTILDILYQRKYNINSDPDLTRNITQLIEARGYQVEDHTVITPDGYILSVQRIPAGQNQPNPNPYGMNGKPAVVLQHGVEDIGTSWVIQESPYQSLGYILADHGFDVWISNVRGTYYSNTSVNLDPADKPYWQFSFDQMAEFDLPTVIDYVLEITGNDQVSYVGHSQGTTMGFIGFANETISEKINLFVALAPVVRVTNCKSALLDFLASIDLVGFFEIVGDKGFLIDTPTMQKWLPIICGNEPSICQNSLALIMGWDTDNINNTRLPVYMAHEPGGTSVMNVAHWAQAVKSGYQKYDYGLAGNILHYGQATPPKYDISQFNAPVIIYYGGNDYLADPTDVKWLLPQLPTLLYSKFIPTYSHLDFVWGEDAYIQVYLDALPYLQKYATVPSGFTKEII